MTIDEAIEDLKENDANHIAEWLEELKAIKESTVFYSNRPIEDIVLEARADAIEEYRMALHSKYADNKYRYESNGMEYWNLDMEEVDEIAEQLKEQKNE